MTSPQGPTSHPPTLSTLELLHRVQAGDRAALDPLYRRYLPRLRSWARGRLPAHARGHLDTEDLVQDVLLRTLRHVETMDASARGCFQAYTRQAVLNAIRNRVARWREQVPPTGFLERQADPAPSPLEETVGRDAMDRFETALARLSPDDREMVVARVEFRCSFQEIADEYGKASADAARMAVKRAVVKLATEMGHERP